MSFTECSQLTLREGIWMAVGTGEPGNGQGRPEAAQLSWDTGESGTMLLQVVTLEIQNGPGPPLLLETSRNRLGALEPLLCQQGCKQSDGYLKSIFWMCQALKSEMNKA